MSSFICLPYDAGTLLRLIHAQISIVFEHSPRSYLTSFKVENLEIHILYNTIDFPYFRIYEGQTFKAFAKLTEDGVGRLFILKNDSNFEKLKKTLFILCKPCICRAGHLYVCMLRSSPLKCTCESLLDVIEKSFKKTGYCPLTHKTESYLQNQENAIQFAFCSNAQRWRLRYVLSAA